jgi:dTDP-glucose 4,6-dehydratase/UDP-glucose 4-epimerase
MKILIIGSKGFIGHSLELYFRSKKNTVYGCDIFPDTSPLYTKVDQIDADYGDVFSRNKYDICINSSGSASVQKSFENPLKDFDLNVHNIAKMMESLKKYNRNCRFINISSAAVYGNPKMLPISEDNEIYPISPYGYHKYLSEIILEEYYHLWGIRNCSARIFSAYGNGLKRQLLSDLARKIKFDQEVRLFGTGNESRDFIHVDDICRAFDCIINRAQFNADKINVANGQQITIKEIVAIFNNIWKHGKTIIFNGPERTGDPINWLADISLLKSYGYRQGVAIYDGIREYIEWIRKEESE